MTNTNNGAKTTTVLLQQAHLKLNLPLLSHHHEDRAMVESFFANKSEIQVSDL